LEKWLGTARQVGACKKPRHGKNIFCGFVAHKKPAGMEEVPMFVAFEVTERLTDAKTGERFLFPEIEVLTWWTNLTEDEATCINLYYNHATSEQFHRSPLERIAQGTFS
jgi:hypothetical protein